MVRVFVRQPVSLHNAVADPSGVTVWGEGLDTIEPTVTITPVVKAAFAAKANRVCFHGPTHTGEFLLADNRVEIELRNARLVCIHLFIYEFQGWTKKQGEDHEH